MGYKQYQQVLNFAAPTKQKTKKTASKKSTSSGDALEDKPIKRRTKTGCFTCRRRKKKCDMDKEDGKCQACIRNFLDCSWPDSCEKKKEEAIKVESPISITSSPELVNAEEEEVKSDVTKGAHAYPSPISSPRADTRKLAVTDINFLLLPPSSTNDYKVSKPKSVKKEQKEVKESKTHFIVTSFNSENELCQIHAK